MHQVAQRRGVRVGQVDAQPRHQVVGDGAHVGGGREDVRELDGVDQAGDHHHLALDHDP